MIGFLFISAAAWDDVETAPQPEPTDTWDTEPALWNAATFNWDAVVTWGGEPAVWNTATFNWEA